MAARKEAVHICEWQIPIQRQKIGDEQTTPRDANDEIDVIGQSTRPIQDLITQLSHISKIHEIAFANSIRLVDQQGSTMRSVPDPEAVSELLLRSISVMDRMKRLDLHRLIGSKRSLSGVRDRDFGGSVADVRAVCGESSNACGPTGVTTRSTAGVGDSASLSPPSRMWACRRSHSIERRKFWEDAWETSPRAATRPLVEGTCDLHEPGLSAPGRGV